MAYNINRLFYLLPILHIITLPIYSMDIGAHLALLNQQLTTLNQSLIGMAAPALTEQSGAGKKSSEIATQQQNLSEQPTPSIPVAPIKSIETKVMAADVQAGAGKKIAKPATHQENLSEQPTPSIPVTPIKSIETKVIAANVQMGQIPASAPSKAGQKLINFKDIAPLLLTQTLNDEAPTITPMVLSKSPHVELAQIIVAWQDLPLKAFFGFSEGLDAAEYSLLLHGYKNARDLIKLFENYNHALYKKLGPLADFYRTGNVDPLLGGGDASCGYHALKNALLVANAVYSSSTAESIQMLGELADLNLVNTLFGKPEQNELINGYKRAGAWRQFMINHPTTLVGGIQQANYDDKKNPTAEWLHEAGINFLWNSSQREAYRKEIENIFTQLGQQEVYQYLYKHQITLIHDLKFFAQGFSVPQNVIERFKKEHFAIFIINAGGNHWISLIISAVGTTTQCIILDSKNWPRYDLPEINTIIKALTGASVPAPAAPEIERRQAEKIKREKYLNDKAQKVSATPTTTQLTRADMKALNMTDDEIDRALLAAKEAEGKKAK